MAKRTVKLASVEDEMLATEPEFAPTDEQQAEWEDFVTDEDD